MFTSRPNQIFFEVQIIDFWHYARKTRNQTTFFGLQIPLFDCKILNKICYDIDVHSLSELIQNKCKMLVKSKPKPLTYTSFAISYYYYPLPELLLPPSHRRVDFSCLLKLNWLLKLLKYKK